MSDRKFWQTVVIGLTALDWYWWWCSPFIIAQINRFLPLDLSIRVINFYLSSLCRSVSTFLNEHLPKGRFFSFCEHHAYLVLREGIISLEEISFLVIWLFFDPFSLTGMYIENLTEYVCHTPLDVFELLRMGQRKLIFAETKMNRRSSR